MPPKFKTWNTGWSQHSGFDTNLKHGILDGVSIVALIVVSRTRLIFL